MAATSVVVKDFRTQIPGELSDAYTWKFPDVITTNKHGSKLLWTILVRVVPREDRDPTTFNDEDWIEIDNDWFDNTPMGDEYMSYICVNSGQIDPATSLPNIRKVVPTLLLTGKNLGRANATNVFCQALRDALGKYNDHASKAVENDDLLPPMLAQSLKDQKNLKFTEAYVQIKLNGLRMMSVVNNDTNEIITYSRGRNQYLGLDYIKDELRLAASFSTTINNTQYTITHLDGEVYKHEVPLQTINSLAKKPHVNGNVELEYHIYDCILTDRTVKYSIRKSVLEQLFKEKLSKCTYLRLVNTEVINKIEDLDLIYRKYLDDGYEGAMVRLDAPYELSYNDYHSKVLLKAKPTLDHEYEIVGYESGLKGKAAGALMIVCVTDTGKQFSVTPKMEIPERIAFYKKMSLVEPNSKTHFVNHWLGRKLIVYFDELSKDKVPLRGRTKMELRTWE